VLAFSDEADLVVMIRKGGTVKRTVAGPDRPPATIGTTDTNMTIGISGGRQPGTAGAQPPPPMAPTTEIGPSEDSFEVVHGRGGPSAMPETAGGPVLWRYMGKNALDAPTVTAVKKFQEAVEAAEKAAKKP
jgi:hypothetical protein